MAGASGDIEDLVAGSLDAGASAGSSARLAVALQPARRRRPAHAEARAHDADGEQVLSRSVEVLALPQVFGLVEAANLPTLAASLQWPELWEEAALLARLLYKSANQHRASKHLQATRQASKLLALCSRLQLERCVRELHAAALRTSLPEQQDGASGRRAKRHQAQPPSALAADGERQAVRLPSRASGCFVLRRLLCACQVLVQFHPAVLAAGRHLSGQLSRGYFMPLCLTAAASLARLRLLTSDCLLQAVQAYNTLAELLPLLPAPAAAAEAAATTAVDAVADGLPQLLAISWAGPLTGLQATAFEPAGPGSLASRAAQLREAFCISWPSCSPVAASVGEAPQLPAQAAAATLGADAELGVSISRQQFAALLVEDRQPAQREQPQQQPTYATASPGLGLHSGAALPAGASAMDVDKALAPAACESGAASNTHVSRGTAAGGGAGAEATLAGAEAMLAGLPQQCLPAVQARPMGVRELASALAGTLAMQAAADSSDDDDVAPAALVARAAQPAAAQPPHQQPATAAQPPQQQPAAMAQPPQQQPAAAAQPSQPQPAAVAQPPQQQAAEGVLPLPLRQGRATRAAKKGRSKQQQQRGQQGQPPVARDAILDMLLQGL